MIHASTLSKQYVSGQSTVPVLVDASFELPSSSLTAIVGKSGSGKSTLLNLIAGLDFPDSGELRFDDTLISSLSPSQLAHFRLYQIGLVFQFFNLLPTLTLEQNVALPGYLRGISQTDALSRARQCLGAVGLSDQMRRRPDQCSGGEIQRAAVARAVVNSPRLILADEPTGNLDAENGENLFDIFRELVSVSKITIILVTHDLDLAKRADHIFRLEQGKVLPCTL